MNIHVSVHGDARRTITDLANKLPRARADALTETDDEILTETIAGTPVQTGRLKRGFEVAAGQTSATHTTDRTEISATNTVRYAGYVEFGTRRMAARRMLGRAIARILPTISQKFRRAFFTA